MSANKTDWIVRLAVGLAVVLGGASLSSGQILIDDFNDGNNEGWSVIDSLSEGGGPGIFDASSGAYNIRSTGDVPPVKGSSYLISPWEPSSSNAIYSNGLVRAKVRNNVDRTDAVLAMRVNSEDISGFGPTGYYFIASSFFSPPRAYMAKISDGEFSGLGVDENFPFDDFGDWNIEAGVVGNQLSMKVWRDGDPEPTTPQLMATDPTPLPIGQIGLATWNGTANSSSFPIDATFDDIYFTPIPEPSTLLLAALVALRLLMRKGDTLWMQ